MRLSLAGLAMVAVLSAGPGESSATTLTISGQGLAAAQAAEAAFLAGVGSVTTETFESFTASNANPGPLFFVTSVGTFTQILAGGGGGSSCGADPCTGLKILDSLTTPFSGRFDVDVPPGTKNWLDSNDSQEMKWEPTPFPLPKSVGFYITDPNDSGGRMDIVTSDGLLTSTLFDDVFGSNLTSGRVFYISIFDVDGLASVKYVVAPESSDGFGIDRFSIGSPVPEPGTLLVLGSGLAGLGGMAWRRRKDNG